MAISELDLLERLTIIRMKVERIQASNNTLEEENRSLKEKLKNSEIEIENQKKSIESLEESNKLIKLAKNFSATGTDKFDTKIKINELVKEIDRCIDLLNE